MGSTEFFSWCRANRARPSSTSGARQVEDNPPKGERPRVRPSACTVCGKEVDPGVLAGGAASITKAHEKVSQNSFDSSGSGRLRYLSVKADEESPVSDVLTGLSFVPP